MWLRCGVALLATSLGTFLTYGLTHFGVRMHSGFMLTAVVVAAWFGGLWPGLLSFVFGIPGQILLRDPIGSWQIHGKTGWAGFWVYVVNSLVICFLFRKRYIRRIRTEVSPAAVTGGWIWKFDPLNEGTVEINSPEFPHLSVTRTFAMWLETVHPKDRAAVERGVDQGLRSGELQLTFHAVREDGEIRKVSMLGVKSEAERVGAPILIATCIEVGVHENAEAIAWSALPC